MTRLYEAYAAQIVRTVSQPIVVLTGELKMEMVRDALWGLVVSVKESEGGHLHDLGNGPSNSPELRKLLNEVLTEKNAVRVHRVEHGIEQIGEDVMLLNDRRMPLDGGADRVVVTDGATGRRPEMSDRVDVAIVGAGTAGLAALREVRKRTEDFVLVDAPPYGTTCARVGCMPSKALIEAANAFHRRMGLEKLGVRGAAALSADLPAVLRRVRKLRDEFVEGVLESTSDLGARRIPGPARLDGPNQLVVEERAIEARQIVLAPGSSPVVPGPWRALGERVLTTDTLFEQESLPPRIGVIGLGPVGVEIAQALARLGLEVHGFDGGDRMAGISDEDVADCLRGCLSEEFPIHLGSEVELKEAEGAVAIERVGARVVVDRVIAAIGRRPNVGSLGLDSLGLPLDENGLPEIDPHTMRIGNTPVLLAGDANGAVPLLHEGADEGHIAGLNAAADAPIRLDRRIPMSVVFCDPEVAIVGETRDVDALVGEVDFVSQGRARIMQQNRGVLRVYAAPSDGRLLGAEMAAPASEHIAHLLALAIGQGLTVFDMLRMPYYHPTLEEG